MKAGVLLIGTREHNQRLQAALLAKNIPVHGLVLQRVIEVTPDKGILTHPGGYYQKFIFVSRNAVIYGLKHIAHFLGDSECFSIGPGTASELESDGISSDYPVRGSSEDLLNLPALKDVTDCRVLIIKGEGGRELLGESLEQRGGSVDFLDVYRRERVPLDNSVLKRLLKDKNIRLLVCGSGEVLEYLSSLLDNSLRSNVRLIVPSQRVYRLARQMGFSQILTAEGAESSNVVSAVCELYKQL